MNHPALSYLSADRLAALAEGRELPASGQGAALTADISGFTALTELLARTRGERRGADELASLLNIVYEVLIAQVERAGAAIISFSGDAMLCWFARDNGAAALRCAAAIQAAMAGLELPPVSGVGSVSLAVKCAIVCGQAYRLRLGDGEIQYLDTLAGPALLDLAAIEQLARPGEIVVDRAIASRLPAPEIKEWRRLSDPELEGAVVEPAGPFFEASSPQAASRKVAASAARRVLVMAYLESWGEGMILGSAHDRTSVSFASVL